MALIVSKSSDGKHEVVFDEEPHCYYLDSEPVVGVTTFNKNAYPESPQLTSWKVGQGAKHVIEALLEKARLNENVDEEWIAETVKSSKAAWKSSASKAASIGTLLHEYAECNEAGKEFNDYRLVEHMDAPKVLACVAKFREWKEKNQDEIISSEGVVASVCHRFAGKYDRLSRRRGRVVLSDFKTSSGIFIDNWLQLASYRLALKEWAGVEVDALEVIRFGKTDADFETKLVTDKTLMDAYEAQAMRNRQTYEFIKTYDRY